MAASLCQRPVFRFAPSPNGRLHLGHALSALLNSDMAKAAGGRFLLRIEDIDRARCTPALEASILEDLRWLGLSWEEPVRRQSEHFDAYRAALGRLAAEGLVYPAFMTRGEVKAWVKAWEADRVEAWPRDPDGAPLYPPLDAHRPSGERAALMAAGRPHAWRLDMEKAVAGLPAPLFFTETEGGTRQVAADPTRWGDAVLSRSDAPSSYHLSVVVDDALQGVTHVVRGHDLFAATGLHRLLQHRLDLPAPLYRHHRLVLGPDGRKLSKSEGSTALATLREAGASPSDIRALVGLAGNGA